jgi:hypothetical protein
MIPSIPIKLTANVRLVWAGNEEEGDDANDQGNGGAHGDRKEHHLGREGVEN